MKKDFTEADLDEMIRDFRELLDKEYKVYITRDSYGYEWSGKDFAKLYSGLLDLTSIVEKQNELIKEICDNQKQ